MAASIVGYTTTQSATRSATISRPSGMANGDVLYLIYQGVKSDSSFGGASVTLPSGWSIISSTDDSGPITGIAYKSVMDVAGEASSYTVSGNLFTITKMQAVLVALRGVDHDNPYVNTPSAQPRYTTFFDSRTQVNAYSPTGVNGLNAPTDRPLTAIQVMSGYGAAGSYTPGDYTDLVTLNQTGNTTFGTSESHILQVRTWLNIPIGTTSPTDPQLITSGFSGPSFEIHNTAGMTVLLDHLPEPESPTCIKDTYTRALADGWGTADTGQAWTIYDEAGVAAAERGSVASGIGRLAVPEGLSTTVDDAIARLGVSLLDPVVRVETQVPIQSVGPFANPISLVNLRQTAATTPDCYEVGLRMDPTNGIPELYIDRMGGTLPDATYLPLSAPATFGAWWVIKADVSGTAPVVLRTKAWPKGSPEPTDWQIDITDSSPDALTAPGDVALGAHVRGYASGEWPGEIWFDNLRIGDCPLLRRRFGQVF